MTPEKIILRHVVAYFKDHAPHLEQNEEYRDAVERLDADDHPHHGHEEPQETRKGR